MTMNKRRTKVVALIIYACLVAISCKKKSSDLPSEVQNLSKYKGEIHGHRGDRGSFPENTIPACISALKKKVDFIEIDVVISKDHQVVVSHEPYMHHILMNTPDGGVIDEANQLNYNLFTMTADSIKTYVAGNLPHPQFKSQQPTKTYKPTLVGLIDTLNIYAEQFNLPEPKFNIELKSNPNLYGKYQPKPGQFVELLMQTLKDKEMIDRVQLQSFDLAVLEYLHENYPDMPLNYLVGKGNLDENLAKLSFRPQAYAVHFELLKSVKDVEAIKNKGMKAVVWTVNEKKQIAQMKNWGVDVIITDYPERALF